MKKMMGSTKVIVLLIMASVLAVMPLAFTACNSSNDEEKPTANFTSSITSGASPLDVQFTDQSTGVIDSYKWEFGDGSTSDEQSPLHTYTADGTYDVSLTVEGPGGKDTVTKTGYIEVKDFVADFTVDQTTGTYSAGDTVTIQFTDQSTHKDTEITAWEWDFGDGDTSTDQSPSHTYVGEVNLYTVSLTITSSTEDTSTKIMDNYIRILPTSDQLQDNKNIVFQAPFATTDVTSTVCDKFADLLNEYTGGHSTLKMYYNAQLAARDQMFDALQSHNIGGALINAGDTRSYDSNLDFSGQLQGLLISAEHSEAVYTNSEYVTFIRNQWDSHEIHYVGYVPTYLIFTYFKTSEIDSLYDLQGTKIYYGKPGTLDPAGKLLGISEQVFYSPFDLKDRVNDGSITAQATPPGLAITLFDSPSAFSDVLLRPFYNVNLFVFDNQVWDGMDQNTRDIIEKVIMPEVKEFADSVDTDSQRADIQRVLDKMSTAHVETCKEEEEIWQKLEVYQPFLDLVAGMNTDIYDLIVELRPQYTDFDPIVMDILDQLTFNGAPLEYSTGY